MKQGYYYIFRSGRTEPEIAFYDPRLETFEFCGNPQSVKAEDFERFEILGESYMKHTFNSREAEAYNQIELITTFASKWQSCSNDVKERFKEFLSDITSTGDRYLEAAIGQFITQLDHINDKR